MWLQSSFGFFSIIEGVGDRTMGMLTIRSAIKADLESLRRRYLPSLGEIQTTPDTAYPYHAKVAREALANTFAQIVRDLDYHNFQGAVEARQGKERVAVYQQVENVLQQMQTQETLMWKRPQTSYGGVLLDGSGCVLLRKPANEFDGYVWTFAKGRPDGESTPEETALREVREETGYDAEILTKIPGSFKTTAGGVNEYFLMRPVGEPKAYDWETEATIWVSMDEAATYISQTRNESGRQRDLSVLAAAVQEYHQYYQDNGGKDAC
jgi:8-oxo-dGTP pyrophosphatase MutT (NUDIX family)